MKKIFCLLFILIIISCQREENTTNDFSISGQIEWSKTFGGNREDKTTGVVELSDGSFIILGYSNSINGDISTNKGLYDVWLTKVDASGNLIWSKNYGGTQDDFGYSITHTQDNHLIIAGYTGSNDGDVSSNEGMHDFLIIKIDYEGTILWSKTYGFMGHDHAHKIIQTKDGGFFVAGFADYMGMEGMGNDNGEGHQMRGVSQEIQHGVGEYFGIKLSANGEFMWMRYYGGTQNDRVYDIAETKDGGVIMIGASESSDFDADGNKGSYDYWLIKIGKDGHLHWKEHLGGSDIDQAFAIATTDFNSFLVVGQSNSIDKDVSKNIGNSDIWVTHINEHGKLLWEKSLGGSQFETALGIKKIGYNQFALIGHSRSNDYEILNKGQNDVILYIIDASVNTTYQKLFTFGGSSFDFGVDVIPTRDRGLLLVGDSQSNNGDFNINRGFNDRFILKIK